MRDAGEPADIDLDRMVFVNTAVGDEVGIVVGESFLASCHNERDQLSDRLFGSFYIARAHLMIDRA